MNVEVIAPRLANWSVADAGDDSEGRLVIYARPRVDGPVTCPACGSSDLTTKGTTTGRYVDRPRAGRSVVIEATRDRWQCDECDHGFSTAMPEVVAGGRFTCDAYEYALEQSEVVPVEVLAETMGAPVSTLRRLVGEGTQPPAVDDVGESGRAGELAVCPLCIRRFDRSMAILRRVPLGALPCASGSRLPICPTCDEEGAPMALRG